MTLDNRTRKSFSLASRMIPKQYKDAKKIGNKLAQIGADGLVDGGFVVILDNVYVSQKFKLITGFNNSVTDSELYANFNIEDLKAYRDLLKSNQEFVQKINLKTNSGVDVLLYCNITKIREYGSIISVDKIVKR